MPSLAKAGTIGVMLAFSFTGLYGSLITAYLDGFLDALKSCIAGGPSSEGCVLDMSHSPFETPRPYTGIPPVDAEIALLMEFFAQGVKRGADGFDLGPFLAFSYMAALFCGAWSLVALEGLRRGSSDTVLRRTGVFGMVFQALTINFVAPIYFTLQLLIDPMSSDPTALFADPVDLEILPTATVISYLLPTAGLALPFLGVLGREGNYVAIALWQPFPLYQSLTHAVLRAIYGGGASAKGSARIEAARQKKALDRVYRFVLRVTIGAHLLVVGTIVASLYLEAIPTTSFSEVLALLPLSDLPTRVLLEPPVSALSSGTIVSSFLRYDIYFTCASIAAWAAYQWQSAQDSSSLAVLACKVVFWTALGGPLTPAAMLLWERDTAVLGRLSQASQPKAKARGKKTQ